MHIGFDAKRAFFNRSGLGSYSRDTISILSDFYPDNTYFLYTPGDSGQSLYTPASNCLIRKPESVISKSFPAWWRSFRLSKLAAKDKIEIFHGLSHELPFGFKGQNCRTIVTIHDLIFLRYPEFYHFTDRHIYLAKFKYSCRVADKIIAISDQTKRDIIEYLKIPGEKIEVVYQGCNPRFYKPLSTEEKLQSRQKYGLPEDYILCVATIEERKNQLVILEALQNGGIDIPLVLVGREKEYSLNIRQYIKENRIQNVYFTGQVPAADLPGLYQNAQLFVYPSIFEGFGIPILEALNSGIPVITSKDSCFPEAGGEGSLYVNVLDPEEVLQGIRKVLEDNELRKEMIQKGHEHAASFREEKIASSIMKVYQSALT